MRFYRDDLGIELPVDWYEVPEDRPVVPYAHPFGSRDWDHHEGDTGLLLGEVYGSRSYRAGPAPTEVTGQGLCGTREQWERGLSLLDKPLPVNPTTGRQCCCGRGGLVAAASSVSGIAVETEGPPLLTTCSFAVPSPLRWRVHLDPYPPPDIPCWPGGLVLPNQDMILSSSGTCRWDGLFWPPVDLVRWRLWRLPPPLPVGGPQGWYLYSTPPTLPNLSVGPTWFLPDNQWNRYGPNIMPALVNGAGCGLPTITVFASW